MRAEDDPDIAPYVHEKQIEFIKCEKGAETAVQIIKKVGGRMSLCDGVILWCIPYIFTMHYCKILR